MSAASLVMRTPTMMLLSLAGRPAPERRPPCCFLSSILDARYNSQTFIVDDECTAHELAVALHKASEYLHKRSGKGGLK